MTNAHLLIDDGVCELRAVALVGGAVRRFFFYPNGTVKPQPAHEFFEGDIVVGQIKAIVPEYGGAFVEIGDSQPAFLAKRRAQSPLVEGEKQLFRIRSRRRQSKGVDLDGDWRAGLTAEGIQRILSSDRSTPGKVSVANTPVLACLRYFSDMQISKLTVGSARLATDVAASLDGQYNAEQRVDETLVWTDEVEEALDCSLLRQVKYKKAVISFDEVQAGTVIDIDGAGDGTPPGAASQFNDRVNGDAITFLAGELDRRGIGGQIMIDFLPPSTPSAFGAFKTRVAQMGRVVDVNRDGFVRLIRPRRVASLWVVATDLAPLSANDVSPKRYVTASWLLREAVRRLEMRLRRQANTRFELILSDTLLDTCELPELRSALDAKYGARHSIRTVESGERLAVGGAYEIIER